MVLQNVVAEIPVPLPSVTTFTKDAYDMAWPQILTFSTAVVGVLAVSMIIRAFSKGG